MNVADILSESKSATSQIGPDATVFEGLQLLASTNVGALMVVEGHRVIGIFSERDYARKVILEEKDSKNTKIKEVMTSQVIFTDIEKTAEECMELMTRMHIRHLPVIDKDSQILGFVSILNVINTVLNEKKQVIKKLENYVSDSWPF